MQYGAETRHPCLEPPSPDVAGKKNTVRALPGRPQRARFRRFLYVESLHAQPNETVTRRLEPQKHL